MPISKSNLDYSPQAAGDNSNLLRGNAVVTEAGGKSKVATKHGKNIGKGALNLENKGKLNTGNEVSNNRGVVNINDLGAFGGLLVEQNKASAQNLGTALDAVGNATSNALNKVSSLAEVQTTGGATAKPVVWIVLALAAVLGVIAWRK